MSILQEVNFGKHYFEIAMILRQSIFINGLLWGTETWYNLSNKEVKDLEALDKILLRRILSVPVSVPTALLYLELGIVPLSYIIQARRIMFLQYILKRKSDDLLRRFFEAQCRIPSKNDWCLTVQNDIKSS